MVTNVILNELPKNPIFRKYDFSRFRHLKNVPPNNCPHCANGGGKGAVMKAAKGKWLPYEPLNPRIPFRTDHGVCGDAKMAPLPHDHELGGKYGFPKSPIVAHYKPGQVVEFVVDVTTNHNGWFEFFICDAVKCGGDVSEACFKKGHCHAMIREKTPVCESGLSKECAPVDEKYPGRWYLPCRKKGFEHFMGGPYMRYKLPSGFESKHAVIQFYWVTANSCNPPGHLDYFKRYPMKAWGMCIGDGGARGGRNPALAECGAGGFPEEFWGCADVSVGAGGRAPGVASPMSPPPPPPRSPQRLAPSPSLSPLPQPLNQAIEPVAPTAPMKPLAPVVQSTPEPMAMNMPQVTSEPVMAEREPEAQAKKMRKCQINWRQCDGQYYKGPRGCCNRKFYCHRVNKYYSQCRRRRWTKKW